MSLTTSRCIEVNNFFKNNGIEKTISHFNLSSETVYRYLRYAKNNDNNIEEEKEPPKVLIFDIETKPLKGWFWDVWKQNISHEQIISDWICLTWSAKWLGHPEIYSGKLTPEEIANEDDSRIMKDIWKFIDASEVVVAHNGDGFDIIRLNTRFLLHHLPPPSPYQSIDTLKIARKKFAFPHNKLDFIGQVLGLGGKLETGGMKLWLKVIDGDKEAIDLMEKYNRRDVTLLEEVYLRFRPWIPSHPNLALSLEDNNTRCPVCTSTSISYMDRFYNTSVGRYSVFRCDDCGSIGRTRVNSLTKEKMKHLGVSVAR